MTSNIIPFNPLDKRNLGASVADTLLAREIFPLSDIPEFGGSGIYAIYYTGNFPAYKQIADLNREGKFLLPIHVGKALPTGVRSGANSETVTGKVLHKRLKEHAESIKAVENLDIADFYCRFLVVDEIWIPLGESLIASRFTPVWNSLIDGFGNHNPGKGRQAGMRPRWDVLHPGRAWAMNLAERPETATQIAQDAETYLKVLPARLARKSIETQRELWEGLD
ncbi:Eco29kI family restriction endonuclease [Burkholderia ubonensis]|uniref:Eco29kI family restriction endonuclease n=1 Tax=Burkholderia ubonensis TaxID=101571 RepID=UPI0009B4E8E1|nr:Eco29kI family restriction endonuclease [Burkholderia ubonensis]